MSENSFIEVYAKSSDTEVDSLYQKARLHLSNKNLSLSGFYFTQILAKQPQAFWATMHLAEIALAQNLFSRSEQFYQQAWFQAKTVNQRCSAKFGWASVYMAAKKPDLAEYHYLQGIAEYPEHVFFYTELAKLYQLYQPNQSEKIIDLYQRALTLAPHLKWIETDFNHYQQQTSKKPVADSYKPTIPIFQLFQQQDWLALFIRESLAVSLLASSVQKQWLSELGSWSQPDFAEPSDFYSYVATHLTQGFEPGKPFADKKQLKAANLFLLRAMEAKITPEAMVYIQLFDRMACLEEFVEAEPLMHLALLDYSENIELLLSLARLAIAHCQLLDRQLKALVAKISQNSADKTKTPPLKLEHAQQLTIEKDRLLAKKTSVLSFARLVSGAAVSIDPHVPTAQHWQDLIWLHEQANQHKAPKFTSLDHYLSKSPVASQFRAMHQDNAYMHKVDGWLHELISLLGDQAIDVFFDLSHYRKQVQVRIANVESGLVHYLTEGWQVNLSVHPSFDVDYVRLQLQRVNRMVAVPELLLFLREEREFGLTANVLFDYSRIQAHAPDRISPWIHYLAEGWQTLVQPSAFFDAEYYLASNPDSGLTDPRFALLHFFSHDTGKVCHRLFNNAFYLDRYQLVLTHKAPIVHYLTEGVFHGFLPNPFCAFEQLGIAERINYLKVI